MQSLDTKAQKKRNIMLDNTDEIIQMLSRQGAAPRTSSFQWSNVSARVHYELLYRIGKELKVPNPRLITSKQMEIHSFDFVNHTSLNSLYSYYKNGIPRRKGVHVITNVCDYFQIPQVTIEDWIDYIGKNNIFSWKNIPDHVKRHILLSACRELGYTHPIFMKNDDFSNKFLFLNNKTLTGFYTFYNNRFKGIRGSLIKNICDTLEIKTTDDDWISYIISDSTSIFWDVVPSHVIRDLLYIAAGALGYSNPRMMSTDDLKVRMDFLNGLSFYSFASRFFGIEKNGVRSIDYICNQYDIPELNFDDWILLISNNKNFRWELLPQSYLKRILYMKAEEEQKQNPRMLKYEDFNSPCRFLNHKSLISLYGYFNHIKSNSSADTIRFICDMLEIPVLDDSQWLSMIGDPDSKASWETVPNHVKRKLLYMAAQEVGVTNPRFMDYQDLCNTKFSFLNGKTLSGFYAYYSSKFNNDQSAIVQSICDTLGINVLSLQDWLTMIADASMVRWETIPYRVQREIVIRAAAELGFEHPRLMGTKEFDDIPYRFLGNKTLSGLYYHYAGKNNQDHLQINEFIFNILNIPKSDINPNTGRLYALDSITHRKFFDSRANFKDFIDEYLKFFSLESLCRKYKMVQNAKDAGIYHKGLITIAASMNKKEYVDFLYELIKNVPRDRLDFTESSNGCYRLEKSDLYTIAGLENPEEEYNEISFANADKASIKSKNNVIKSLKIHQDILTVKIRKFHEINCTFLIMYKGFAIFYCPVAFYPGELVTANTGDEFEVSECRERKSNDGYVLELKPLSPIQEEDIPENSILSKDSNDSILSSFLEKLVLDIKNDQLSPLLGTVLGLRKESGFGKENLLSLSQKDFFNKKLALNPPQRQAVELACTLDDTDHPLAIVQGPPGTGKTTLIEEIALQYYHKGKNVLILAKTNIAVDNILEKLVQEEVRVLRTGNNIENKSALPYAYLFSTSNAVYMSGMKRKNRIVLGTPLGFFWDKQNMEKNFDLLIVDEASQMDIPETLFALSFAGKCVMIGDHMQIPPFPVQNEILQEYNPHINLNEREVLQHSLFEQLITDQNRFHSVFLSTNYRTENPELVSLISNLVYDGKLGPNLESPYYRQPESQRCQLFPKDAAKIIDTAELTDQSKRGETELNSTYFNLYEGTITVDKIYEFIKSGEKLQDISIITPYKAQVEKLRELFLRREKYFTPITGFLRRFIEENICTIDSFQGKEQDIILINWVRSNYDGPGIPRKTGFLRDFRRLNVAISRARKRLIMIGDFDTLTQSENMTVRYFFKKIKDFNEKKPIIL